MSADFAVGQYVTTKRPVRVRAGGAALELLPGTVWIIVLVDEVRSRSTRYRLEAPGFPNIHCERWEHDLIEADPPPAKVPAAAGRGRAKMAK